MTIEESTFESQLSVSHAAVRTASSREASKADATSTIEAENATGLVEMVNEPDGSRVQPTHHGGVWGFVPYLPNSRHVQHGQQSTPQIVNKRWRSGNLHLFCLGGGPHGWVPVTVLPKWEEAVGSSQAPQPNKPNTHKSHAQLPHVRLSFFTFLFLLFLACPNFLNCSIFSYFHFSPVSFFALFLFVCLPLSESSLRSPKTTKRPTIKCDCFAVFLSPLFMFSLFPAPHICLSLVTLSLFVP